MPMRCRWLLKYENRSSFGIWFLSGSASVVTFQSLQKNREAGESEIDHLHSIALLKSILLFCT